MGVGLWIVCGSALATAALAVLVALCKSGAPVRRLLASGVQGLCALAAVNVAGMFTGVSLGLGVVSGGVCLVLGVPGVAALLALKTIFGI